MSALRPKRRTVADMDIPRPRFISRWDGREEGKAAMVKEEAGALAQKMVGQMSRAVLFEARDAMLGNILRPKAYNALLGSFHTQPRDMLPEHMVKDLERIGHGTMLVQAYQSLGSSDEERVSLLKEALLADVGIGNLFHTLNSQLPGPLHERLSLEQEIFRSRYFKVRR